MRGPPWAGFGNRLASGGFSALTHAFPEEPRFLQRAQLSRPGVGGPGGPLAQGRVGGPALGPPAPRVKGARARAPGSAWGPLAPSSGLRPAGTRLPAALTLRRPGPRCSPPQRCRVSCEMQAGSAVFLSLRRGGLVSFLGLEKGHFSLKPKPYDATPRNPTPPHAPAPPGPPAPGESPGPLGFCLSLWMRKMSRCVSLFLLSLNKRCHGKEALWRLVFPTQQISWQSSCSSWWGSSF